MHDLYKPLNAFCVDLEEWFHSFGIRSRYNDPRTWDDAPSCVVADTEVLMRLLDDAGARGTFLTVGWVAKKHPDLIRRLAREGHEVGCHSYWHRLVFEMTPDEFEHDLVDCLAMLRDLTGQPVDTYRAPGFSVTTEAVWCYPSQWCPPSVTTVESPISPAIPFCWRRLRGTFAAFRCPS